MALLSLLCLLRCESNSKGAAFHQGYCLYNANLCPTPALLARGPDRDDADVLHAFSASTFV